MLLLVDLHIGLRLAEIIEQPLFLHRLQEHIGIVRIERLTGLHRPDAIDFRLGLQVEPHNCQFPHGELRSRFHPQRQVDNPLVVVDRPPHRI